MAQLFHRSSNVIAKASILAAVVLLGLLSYALYAIELSPYYTTVGMAPEQPVPFSHRHHVGELGLDCRYCHTSVENSSFAGLPPTQTCMTCHSQIWTNAAMLEPVRNSYRTTNRSNGFASTLCPTSSISITASTSARVSAAPPATARRADAAHLSREFALHGVVPGLPSPAGKIRAPAFGSFQCQLSAACESDRDGHRNLWPSTRFSSLQNCSTCHR